MVPLADSVARVTARFRRVVTCDKAPSATCSLPAPSVAFSADWVSAVTLACKPLAMAKPAASSAPELIREPVDKRYKVFCRPMLVTFNWFSAANDGMLYRILIAMGYLLSHGSSLPELQVSSLPAGVLPGV